MKLKRMWLLAAVGFTGLLSSGLPASAATAPPLGTAASFAVLGGSTVTNTGATILTGDLGVWPGLAITGFPPGSVTGTTHAGDAVALQAQSDVTTAYNNLAGQACNTNLTGQNLGGLTLTPGAYCFSTSAQLTGTLTLDAQGVPGAVWVFQIGSTLTTASNSRVLLTNSGQSCNVFWQIGSSATLGTGTLFAGNILALTSITLNTGASMTGRALARNGAVTLDTNNVNVSSCAAICPPITLSPSTLPSGNLGVLYSQTISASGGAAPYVFTVSAGVLPPGLTLVSSGPSTALLSGTPTATGTFTFTVTATDSNNCPGSQPYTITINPLACPPLTILPATLPAAVVGAPYSQPITAAGSTPDTYVYTVSAGALPPGLSLVPVTPPAVKTVNLAGTPTTAGTYSFTITATDANGCQISQAYTMLVNPAACPVITVLPATLPIPVPGVFYSQVISATGGSGLYVFTVSAGTLPPGLTLTPAGPTAAALLSGTPTATGTFNFTITATDANGCPGSQAYTMAIGVMLDGIPTLPGWAMFLFATLLGVAGYAAIRWFSTS